MSETNPIMIAPMGTPKNPAWGPERSRTVLELAPETGVEPTLMVRGKPWSRATSAGTYPTRSGSPWGVGWEFALGAQGTMLWSFPAGHFSDLTQVWWEAYVLFNEKTLSNALAPKVIFELSFTGGKRISIVLLDYLGIPRIGTQFFVPPATTLNDRLTYYRDEPTWVFARIRAFTGLGISLDVLGTDGVVLGPSLLVSAQTPNLTALSSVRLSGYNASKGEASIMGHVCDFWLLAGISAPDMWNRWCGDPLGRHRPFAMIPWIRPKLRTDGELRSNLELGGQLTSSLVGSIGIIDAQVNYEGELRCAPELTAKQLPGKLELAGRLSSRATDA